LDVFETALRLEAILRKLIGTAQAALVGRNLCLELTLFDMVNYRQQVQLNVRGADYTLVASPAHTLV